MPCGDVAVEEMPHDNRLLQQRTFAMLRRLLLLLLLRRDATARVEYTHTR